jgi:hypothetical protein
MSMEKLIFRNDLPFMHCCNCNASCSGRKEHANENENERMNAVNWKCPSFHHQSRTAKPLIAVISHSIIGYISLILTYLLMIRLSNFTTVLYKLIISHWKG